MPAPGAVEDIELATDVAALSLSNGSKTFASQRALDDVTLTIARGEIRALVGENGSGKSTLVKVLAGYYQPDPGAELHVGGQKIAFHRPGASDAAGLRFVHQDLALVSTLSTVENLGVGRGFGARRAAPVRWHDRRREAQETMRNLGYDFDVDLPVARLEASERTAVAVARAVAPHHTPARVLVLDEPTANLPGREVDRLFDLIRTVRASGIGILFISHHLNEVFDLCESVTVLRGGRHVSTRSVSDLSEDKLIELMVGREVVRSLNHLTPEDANGPMVLRVANLQGATVHGVDLSVSAREIVGIAGITGSGREAIAPLIFGATGRAGDVLVDGSPLPANDPHRSVRAGVALVPADRHTNAVIPGLDVRENLTIAGLQEFTRRGIFRRRIETRSVRDWLARLDVRPPQPQMQLTQLSGGNAQKVVFARWLRLKPRVLLLDEPTQGVDVGAREEIHQLVEAAASEGCAVVICSTDSDELARCCTRVVVLVRGRIAQVMHAPLNADEITAAAIGSDQRGGSS